MGARANDAVHMRRALLSALLAGLAVAAVLSACGDGEQRRIAHVLSAGFTSRDPRVVCEGSLSPALLARIYGGIAKCHALESEAGERISQAQSVDVRGVRVHGRSAAASVVIHGGNHDGARGALSLHHDAGGWRVSDISVALLRSQFEAGLRRMQSIDDAMKTCVTRRMRGLADGEFRKLAFGADAAAHARLTAVARRCHERIAAVRRLAA
jgi:hypothetical protein